MKSIKGIVGVVLTLLLVIVLYSSCTKSDEIFLLNESSGQKQQISHIAESMIDSVFVSDTVINRVYTVYDACKSNLGTLTVNWQNQLRYTGQTITTVTIAGTSSMTFTKGVFYYFSPSGGCTGCNTPYFLYQRCDLLS